MKKYFILLLAALAVTACDHDEIYEEIDFQVQLSPANTYRAGEPVQFLFGGNADYIVFYSGETGHEYRFRNRTQVAPEDIESCELVVQLNGRSGTPCMSAYVTDAFDGLTATDEAADLAAISGMLTEEKDLNGWTKLDLNDPEKNTEWATTSAWPCTGTRSRSKPRSGPTGSAWGSTSSSGVTSPGRSTAARWT